MQRSSFPGFFKVTANVIAMRPAALAPRSGLSREMTDRTFLKNLSLPVISVLRCSTDSAIRGLTALAESLIMNMFNIYMGQQEPMQGPHPRQARFGAVARPHYIIWRQHS